MFFSLACLANCSKLVKLTHLETTEKKIEVWWKTKKNPKKYYWILNSKEPTPFFLKNYLFTLALFPSTLHFFQWQNQLAPNSCPPPNSQWKNRVFHNPESKGHSQGSTAKCNSRRWVSLWLPQHVSIISLCSDQVGRLELEVNFSLGRAGLFWLGKWGGEKDFMIFWLYSSYRDSPPKKEVFTVQSFYKSSITAIWTPLNQVYSTPWNFPQTTNISKVCLLKCSWSVFTSFSWSYLSYPQKRPQRRAFLRESLVHLPVFQSLLCFFCSFGSCWGRLGPSTKTEKYEKSWGI